MTESSGRGRWLLDRSWDRRGTVVIAGSPLRIFRLTEAGARVAAQVEAGDPVPESSLIERLREAGAIHPVPGPAELHRPADVTVVTPVYRRGSDARQGEELPANGAGDRFIVDDGSDPPIPGARVRSAENRGPAAARNLGFDHVTTALVAFVDDDVDAPADWFVPLLGHFDEDRVALVAPRVVTAIPAGADLDRDRLLRYELRHSPLDLGDRPARIRSGTRVSYVPAAALVCRVDALREIGGFDESLRVGEDVDLVWRLDRAGWSCRYDPSVILGHAPRRTWWAWIRQRVEYGSSAVPLAARHPGALAPVRMNPWSVATWAAMLTWPTAGLAIASISAGALTRRLAFLDRGWAFWLGFRGNLAAGPQLATAVRRAWWPLLAIAAWRSRWARRALAASALAARHPIRLADDLASSIGLWRAMVRDRRVDPLCPALSAWPERGSAGSGPRSPGNRTPD